MSSCIECRCGRKFTNKKALCSEVKDDLQLRVWQHVLEGHAPLTWEQIVELPITSNADPESDAEAGGAPASDQERLDNLESAVDLLCRGWERLAEDMRQLRRTCRSRSRSR
jgi:hypothetical protein